MNVFNFFDCHFLFGNFLAKTEQSRKARSKGFTLIEFLIVIVVICILAAVAFLATQSSLASGRDARRKGELSQVKNVLQQYYLANDRYPTTTVAISLESDNDTNGPFTQAMKGGGYLPVIPRDPKYTSSTGEYTYKYIATTTSSYSLCAKSESKGGYICVSQDSGGTDWVADAPMFGEWGGAAVDAIATSSPQTMADDAIYGEVAWTGIDNAKVSDNAYAIADCSPYGGFARTFHYLEAKNFGFSIPADATINGILAEVESKGTHNGNTSLMYIHVLKNGALSSSQITAQAVTTVEQYYLLGSSSSLWGETWTPSDINDPNFGIAMAAFINGGYLIYVDHIRMTVYYTR